MDDGFGTSCFGGLLSENVWEKENILLILCFDVKFGTRY